MKTAKKCMCVLVVLSVAVVSIHGCKRRAHTYGLSAVQTMQSNFGLAIEAFKQDVGRYPSTQEGLGVLYAEPSSNADGWKGPYLKRPAPPDPWGHDFQYVCPGRYNEDSYDLWSFGPDGKDGTDDDVTNRVIEFQY